MIDVNRDLLGAALGGDMLGAGQRRPARVIGKPEEILRDQRHRPPRAPLPRRVSRRIDDNLTHDSPTTMVRIATRNEEPGQRLSYPHSSGLGPVTVQVPQCGTHLPAALDRPGKLPGSPPRLCVDQHRSSTVLDRKAALHAALPRPASNHPRVGHRVTPAAGAEADTAARRQGGLERRRWPADGRAGTLASRESDHRVCPIRAPTTPPCCMQAGLRSDRPQLGDPHAHPWRCNSPARAGARVRAVVPRPARARLDLGGSDSPASRALTIALVVGRAAWELAQSCSSRATATPRSALNSASTGSFAATLQPTLPARRPLVVAEQPSRWRRPGRRSSCSEAGTRSACSWTAAPPAKSSSDSRLEQPVTDCWISPGQQ